MHNLWKKTLLIGVALFGGFVIFRTTIVGLLYLILAPQGLGGTGDWTYKLLPGDYEIWRNSNYDIQLCEATSSNSAKTVIDSCVISFASVGNSISIKRIPDWKGEEYHEEQIEYYIVDSETGEIDGPLSYDAFNEASAKKGLVPYEWINTDSRPDGAIW